MTEATGATGATEEIRLPSQSATAQQGSRDPDHGTDHTQLNPRAENSTPLSLASAAFSFFVAGVNDGSIGAVIPFLIRDYKVSSAVVSSM